MAFVWAISGRADGAVFQSLLLTRQNHRQRYAFARLLPDEGRNAHTGEGRGKFSTVHRYRCF